ncbi:GUN4-like [Cryptosporangium aurantiacum]|uniref:GUN4-like n=2 Tax=Cryptosporangium aurantiacum TaxID=134849 RepID=A0A1M7RLE1_9ACTN|nr:GUN4-like [Cryptosporangium aurantiacum]
MRLAHHLRVHDLSVWIDADIRWGTSFTRAINSHIRQALAILVVMSPEAEKSEWVEREILEGQRSDRQFLPILLRGDRFFLLAATHYFDARGDRLPGRAEVEQLRELSEKALTGANDAPTIVLPQAPADDLVRTPASGAALRRIEAHLAGGETAHADILTTALLLDSVGRLSHGWLRQDDGDALPRALLDEVDALWARHSSGGFGFRAQARWRVSRPPDAGDELTVRDFSRMATALGWRTGGGATPRYGLFVERGQGRPGFFPTLRNPQLERYPSWHDQWMRTVLAVHRHLPAGGARW